MKLWSIMGCFFILIGSSACGNVAESTVIPALHTPTLNTIIVTLDTTRASRELPPTWTPTDTPTITPTPSATLTLTVTPSLTPFDVDLICEDFTYNLIPDGESYDEGEIIRLSYGISPTYHYAFVGVVLEHEELEDVFADIVPGGTTYTSSFVVDDFPFSGRWDYRVGVFMLNGEDILCQQDGYFYIAEKTQPTQASNRIPTAQPVPSITPTERSTEADCRLIC